MSAVEKFPLLLLEAEEESSVVPPCFSSEGVNYLYVMHNSLYLLALTKRNTNVAQLLLFLNSVVKVLTEYFKKLTEESIRDNFVIIYELLDEMMDYGYPQTTDVQILKEYITQKSRVLDLINSATGAPQARPPAAVTNAVSWRSENIKYRKNEAYLDVVESLNMMISPAGKVLSSEILGSIQMRCYLSGMPELRLGLNDRVIFDHLSNSGNGTSVPTRTSGGKAIELEDIKFHQCVRLSKFENDRTISFIPPDGEFELMSYRLNTLLKPLILVDCKVHTYSKTRYEIIAKVHAQFKSRSHANNVVIKIPVPEDADSPKFMSSQGSVKWKPELSAVVWTIKKLGGGKEATMKAELGLPSVQEDVNTTAGNYNANASSLEMKKPISVNFEIPFFTTSGIQVRYLKIMEPKLQYPSFPWVRYITKSGKDYTIRM